MTLNSLFSG